MKVIIAGGRNFNDYEKLCQFCDKALSKQTEIEIVSGTANGADKLGEKYANDNGYPIKQFPADWDKYGKSAGYKRNAQIAWERVKLNTNGSCCCQRKCVCVVAE